MGNGEWKTGEWEIEEMENSGQRSNHILKNPLLLLKRRNGELVSFSFSFF